MSAARKPLEASVIAFPPRRAYQPGRRPPPIGDLPFVKGRGNDRVLWSLPKKSLDFAESHKPGHEYAGHLLQFMTDNGDTGDWLLFAMLQEMIPTKPGSHGVAWAFVTVLTDVLIAATAHVDWYAIIDASNARIDRDVADADRLLPQRARPERST